MTWLTNAFDRFSDWFDTFLTACDQFAAVWIRGWLYVWFNAEKPSADETISAWVGRNAIAGRPWALLAEKIIDAIMITPGHCRRAVERDRMD